MAQRIAEQKTLFLVSYRAARCNVAQACEAISISRRTIANWRKADPTFAEAMNEVKADFTDGMEDVFPEIALDKGIAPSVRVDASQRWLNANARDRGFGYSRQPGDGGRPETIQVNIVQSSGELIASSAVDRVVEAIKQLNPGEREFLLHELERLPVSSPTVDARALLTDGTDE
jgi:hypothetical protein